MKKTTRIISLLLTLAMMLTLAVPMTVSASFTDVNSNHVYHEAINNLSAEGILNGFEDGSFKPQDPVTRAQFTKIICYALSVGSLTYSDAERSIFTDVAPQHWAANNIVTAYKQGIINGMGDGTFAPEANVNYEQAVKMVVCALGYEQNATNLGGYPYGYLSVANSKKIISGIVDCKIGEAMNRGAVAKLIDNMLSTERVDEDGITGGSIRDEVNTAKKVNGQVIAGYGVALYSGTNPCYKNQIELDLGNEDVEENLFIISEIDNFDINKYIGRNVTVYYETEEGSSDKIATSIALQSKKNEEIEIDLDQIVSYDSSSIEYYKNTSRTETETVYYSSNSKNLFNGEYTSTDVDDLLDDNYQKSGSITLISPEATGEADVVVLKAYDLLVVSHIDKTNKTIYAKNSPYDKDGIVADTEDKTKNVTIKKAGKDVSITSLKQNDTLSVAKSLGGNVIEILVSNQSAAAGTIIEIDNESKQIKLDSGSKYYTLLHNFVANEGKPEEVTVGRHITIYFDAFGKGARVVFTAEKTYDYGYISALDYSEKEEKMSVILYKAAKSDQKLSDYEYYFADKIEINGETKRLESDILEIVQFLKDEAKKANHAGIELEEGSVEQPIRYLLDNSGRIKALTTVSGTSSPSVSKLAVQYAEVKCTLDGQTLGGYRISNETLIMFIDEEKGEYYSKSNKYFKKDENVTYKIQFANVSSTDLAQCIYVYRVAGDVNIDISTQITEDTMPMIVKNISGVKVDNSTKKFVLLDVTTGVETECYDNQIKGTEKLSIGDVVRVATAKRTTDDNKEYTFIEILEVLADAEEVVADKYEPYETTDGKGTDIDYDFRTLIGEVTAKDSSGFKIVGGYIKEGTEEFYELSSSVKVYMVDTKAEKNENKVQDASKDDFDYNKAGLSSRIMIYTKDAKVQSIIVFR